MKKTGIVTDSHSSISQQQAQTMGISVLPMPFYINGTCYYEDITLSRDDFFRYLKEGADISTSQPSPSDVMEYWDKALEEYEEILYIPISSGLSGSCQSATAISMEEPYQGKVFVVDNGRVSTPLYCTILDALEMIQKGLCAREIKAILEKYRDDMVIYVGVDTLEHLKKGGRISPASAALGNVLNIKPVLKFGTGTLDTYKKCRGFQKAKAAMLDAMEHDLTTRFRQWYEADKYHLVAASSASVQDTEKWLEEIRERFPGKEILSADLSLGTSAHIGYGGLGIGCSCKPKF